jgi:hypothetical protein
MIILIIYRYLNYITLPRPSKPSAQEPHEQKEREQSSRLSALSSFSLGDLVEGVRDGSKSVKFPEKLIRVLETRLQSIAMGKDAR